jgi:hypothetical protein
MPHRGLYALWGDALIRERNISVALPQPFDLARQPRAVHPKRRGRAVLRLWAPRRVWSRHRARQKKESAGSPPRGHAASIRRGRVLIARHTHTEPGPASGHIPGCRADPSPPELAAAGKDVRPMFWCSRKS